MKKIILDFASEVRQQLRKNNAIRTLNGNLTDINKNVISTLNPTNALITTFDATNTKDGSVIYFAGRTSVNDGGGGVFTYSSTSTATVDGGIVFAPTGGGRLLREGYHALGFNDTINVGWFGAKGDGSTIDTTAIQNTINKLVSLGGGVAKFYSGTYLSEKITLFSGIILEGEGSAATVIKLKDTTNTALIETIGFSTLTGTNSWFVDTENVPYGFGFRGIMFDGNKANQTSGNCINIYGKKYLVDDVIVKDSYGIGWYTESAYKGGQHDYRDMPETHISGLYIYRSGSHGFQMRGSHDSNIASLFVSQAGGDGVRVEGLVDTYLGSCDIGLIHSYGNVGMGFYCNTLVNANIIIGETNGKEGVVFDTGSGISEISIIRAFNNDYANTGTYYNVKLASGVQVGAIHILENIYQSAGGVRVNSAQVQITNLNSYSSIAHNGNGLYINAGDCQIDNVIIEGYSGATGVGVNIPTGSRIKATGQTKSCKTHVKIDAIGNSNILEFSGLSAAGETQYSGITDFFGTNDVKLLYSDGTTVYAKHWKPSQEIMFPPVSATPTNNGEMVFELTSATQLTVKVKSGGTVRSAVITLS